MAALVATTRKVPVRIVVVVTFALGATLAIFAREAATYHLFGGSVQAVDAILGNAIPSVDHLSNARGALRSLRALSQAIGPVTTAERPEVERQIGAIVRETQRHVATYESFPLFPGEDPKQRELDAAMSEVAVAASRLAVATDEREARRADERIDEVVDEVDRTVEALIVLNARGAADAAHEIIARQEEARRISLALLACVLAAVAAAALLAERRLARADRETRRLIEELDAFAARAAHDLRGPLAPAVMGVSMLRRAPGLDAEDVKTLDAIGRSHARIAAIIDGLLAFARSGAAARDERSLLDAAVADVLPGLERLAAEEGAALDFEVPPGVAVAASQVVVGSLLDNLARNALIYLGESTERRVTVRARVEHDAAHIEVADTGPGMPRDVLARIFRPFERASLRAGTGLGLATVKRLAEGHGGSVTVRSEVGRGSVFTVRLPLSPPTT